MGCVTGVSLLSRLFSSSNCSVVYPVKLILVERNNLGAELESQGVQHDLIPSAEVFPDTSTTTSRVRQDQFEHSKRTTKGRDVVFVVRTAEQFHQKRIGVLLDTWISRTQPYQVMCNQVQEDSDSLPIGCTEVLS